MAPADMLAVCAGGVWGSRSTVGPRGHLRELLASSTVGRVGPPIAIAPENSEPFKVFAGGWPDGLSL